MKILMMTNTYAPMTGGIEESIRSFTGAFENLGHEVLIVAPECEGAPPDEEGVIRLRAIQNFSHSDFSMALPMSGLLSELMKTFMPDIVHCHHPFWMGDIALRLCSQNHIPLVFTYHTMFEYHMHYLPTQSEGAKRFIIELFAGYANLANQVVAPSESVRAILLERGVKTPIEVLPTGVNLRRFSLGEKSIIRRRFGISDKAVIIGFVGRIALEKNLEFLSRSVADYLRKDVQAHFLVVGEGPLEDQVKRIFYDRGLGERVHLAGLLKDQDLVDCYHAMNVFAFASLSETQGIVLVEAMASGVPVVAVDAPGIREVVKDGYNGRLIFEEDQKIFCEALSWCLNQPEAEFLKMKDNARATAQEFDDEPCAQRMLELYQKVRAREYTSSDLKGSPWYALSARLKSEWGMFKNMMQAGGAAIADAVPLKKITEKKSRARLLNIPRLLSLNEWTVRLLRLVSADGTETEPGLVFIQIDGLSQQQLISAFSQRRMPFLKGLFQKKYYRMYSHYPGLPSSTPSVQGELFYGVKQCVPAFAFFDRAGGKIFRMYDSESVIEIERRLTQQGQGLLQGGSSYSNIYSGGAEESHFCAAILGWDKIWKEVNPARFVVFVFLHLFSFLRMLALTLWEIVLGIVDFWRGVFKGANFKKAWSFIYLRALICVLLRELVAVGTKIDIARGLPIIHLNLLGYDELAHNQGPSSPAAHWSLKGIDRAIERIYYMALHSPRRSYDVWIYSDHGQEEAESYELKYGRSVQEAVAEILKEFDVEIDPVFFDKNGVQLNRVRFFGSPFIQKLPGGIQSSLESSLEKKLVVTAIGPTGNIYLPQKMETERLFQFARELVEKAKIPVVMHPEDSGRVRVWTGEGEFTLPQDAKEILGADHPFLMRVTEDLIRVCHHPNAGDLTFMGYRPGHTMITFPLEKGSHAGPGPQETSGFALLPLDVLPRQRDQAYVTPMDLRFAALRFLKRPVPAKQYAENLLQRKTLAEPETIRIMTYNVHSCIGTDGKISPERIARVIGRHDPDIVALQEVDVRRKRTGGVDQPRVIVNQLEMFYHFHPSIKVEEEQYGNAVFSRYPMKLIRAGQISSVAGSPRVEPRGAIWAVIKIGGRKVNLFNTHLGLLYRERTHQVKALFGNEWIGHPACQGPIILCGDLNALPGSRSYHNIRAVLQDAQVGFNSYRPKATWFSHYPIRRIDHIFISPEIEVTHVDVSWTDLDKMASDHLPLIVDIKIKN